MKPVRLFACAIALGATIADYLSRLQGPTRERLKMHHNGVTGD